MISQISGEGVSRANGIKIVRSRVDIKAIDSKLNIIWIALLQSSHVSCYDSEHKSPRDCFNLNMVFVIS